MIQSSCTFSIDMLKDTVKVCTYKHRDLMKITVVLVKGMANVYCVFNCVMDVSLRIWGFLILTVPDYNI